MKIYKTVLIVLFQESEEAKQANEEKGETATEEEVKHEDNEWGEFNAFLLFFFKLYQHQGMYG